MLIEYDTDKRDETLKWRGLDFARAAEVFSNVVFNYPDQRKPYNEARFITVGI